MKMSSRRDKKGFTKLAPTEELALNEIVAINSGSELELLDLSSTVHRRGGEDDRNGCCCYGWCVTGCLLLLTIVVVVLSLGIAYLAYSLHQLQAQVSTMEHRVNAMNSSVISVQSKVAADHKMYDRKYYIMIASTARSLDMLNRTLTTVQESTAEDNKAKEFVIKQILSLNSTLSVLAGFSRQVSTVYLSMAQAASRMKSMSMQLNELARAQGDLKGEMDKLTNTASADHDLTQALQTQTTKQLNQFAEGFHNLQQTAANMSKQLEQLEWVPLSLQDLTTALLNTTQMMKALSYEYNTPSPASDSMTTNPAAETTSSTNPTAPTSSNVEPTSDETNAPINSNTPFNTEPTSSDNTEPTSSDNTEPTTSASSNIPTEPYDASTTPGSVSTETAPSTSSSTDTSTDSASTPNQVANNSTLATEDNPHTGTNSTSTVNTPTSDTPDNTSDIPFSTTNMLTTTDTSTNAATYTPTNETDTPTTAATDTPPTNETDTPPTNETDTPPTNETDTPPTNETDTPTTNETDTPPTNETDTPPTNETDTPTTAATDIPINETDMPTTTMAVTPSTSLVSTSFTTRERLPLSTVGRVSATPLPITPTGNGAIRKPVELLEAVLEQFSQLDTDHSDSLEWSEFSNALNDKGIFDKLDRIKLKDGSLSREELQSAIDVLRTNDAKDNSAR